MKLSASARRPASRPGRERWRTAAKPTTRSARYAQSRFLALDCTGGGPDQAETKNVPRDNHERRIPDLHPRGPRRRSFCCVTLEVSMAVRWCERKRTPRILRILGEMVARDARIFRGLRPHRPWTPASSGTVPPRRPHQLGAVRPSVGRLRPVESRSGPRARRVVNVESANAAQPLGGVRRFSRPSRDEDGALVAAVAGGVSDARKVRRSCRPSRRTSCRD